MAIEKIVSEKTETHTDIVYKTSDGECFHDEREANYRESWLDIVKVLKTIQHKDIAGFYTWILLESEEDYKLVSKHYDIKYNLRTADHGIDSYPCIIGFGNYEYNEDSRYTIDYIHLSTIEKKINQIKDILQIQ
jgi:hypothetical protein